MAVSVTSVGDEGAVVHFDRVEPSLTDNSRVDPEYHIIGVPKDKFFLVGHTPLKYEASDEAGNKANCIQNIHVKGRPIKYIIYMIEYELLGYIRRSSHS